MPKRIYMQIAVSAICLVISIMHQRYDATTAWVCCILANLATIFETSRRIKDLDMEKDISCRLQVRLYKAGARLTNLEYDNECLIEHAHANDIRVSELNEMLKLEKSDKEYAFAVKSVLEDALEEQNKKLQDAQALNEYLGRVVNNMDKVISLDTKLINSMRKTNDMQAKEIEQLTGHLW